MRAVILAGGKGTRLAPYTTVFPKPLMPVRDTPILEIVIRQLREHGFDDIVLSVGYLSHLMKTYFGDGSHLGVNITYSMEDRALGTAGPLSLVPPSDEPILVMNGDLLTTIDYSDIYRYHSQMGAATTIGLYPRRIKIDLGVLKTNGGNEIIEYVEKPEYEHLVSMGIYIVNPSVQALIPYNQRLDFPDLVSKLLAEGQRVVGYRFEGYWLDIGRPDDYERACAEFDRLRPLFLRESTKPALARSVAA